MICPHGHNEQYCSKCKAAERQRLNRARKRGHSYVKVAPLTGWRCRCGYRHNLPDENTCHWCGRQRFTD